MYAELPKHFLYDNTKGDWTLAHSSVTITKDLAWMAGSYIVMETKKDGGGTGHGPHDVYPDGHHVFCQKYNDQIGNRAKPLKVDFYQTGCFTCMLPDIKPIAQAQFEEKFTLSAAARKKVNAVNMSMNT